MLCAFIYCWLSGLFMIISDDCIDLCWKLLFGDNEDFPFHLQLQYSGPFLWSWGEIWSFRSLRTPVVSLHTPSSQRGATPQTAPPASTLADPRTAPEHMHAYTNRQDISRTQEMHKNMSKTKTSHVEIFNMPTVRPLSWRSSVQVGLHLEWCNISGLLCRSALEDPHYWGDVAVEDEMLSCSLSLDTCIQVIHFIYQR